MLLKRSFIWTSTCTSFALFYQLHKVGWPAVTHRVKITLSFQTKTLMGWKDKKIPFFIVSLFFNCNLKHILFIVKKIAWVTCKLQFKKKILCTVPLLSNNKPLGGRHDTNFKKHANQRQKWLNERYRRLAFFMRFVDNNNSLWYSAFIWMTIFHAQGLVKLLHNYALGGARRTSALPPSSLCTAVTEHFVASSLVSVWETNRLPKTTLKKREAMFVTQQQPNQNVFK